MGLMNLICPNSPPVWDGNRFSECFSDIVLGFGVNTMTLVVIIVFGITYRTARGNGGLKLLEKVALRLIPALGASVAFLDMTLLLKDALITNSSPYHEWLFRGSQFLIWLLCLARAFLKSSKVLCLDECTANVDTQTASKLQNAISSECRGMTVITIAHRISTVLNMDSILIFDQGVLVEQGNPQILLQDEQSRFSSFARASTM